MDDLSQAMKDATAYLDQQKEKKTEKIRQELIRELQILAMEYYKH